jgi:hypothetical protein
VLPLGHYSSILLLPFVKARVLEFLHDHLDAAGPSDEGPPAPAPCASRPGNMARPAPEARPCRTRAAREPGRIQGHPFAASPSETRAGAAAALPSPDPPRRLR